MPWRASAESHVVSPVRNCLCAQDYLEPVLRTFAEQAGPGELRFGVEEGGAVLVRPDGYVGWRARTAGGDRAATLHAAVSDVLGCASA